MKRCYMCNEPTSLCQCPAEVLAFAVEHVQGAADGCVFVNGEIFKTLVERAQEWGKIKSAEALAPRAEEREKTEDLPSQAQENLRDKIMAERAKGNVVFWGLPDQLAIAPLEQFVEQPAEGILYDLNRLEEVCMTFITDKKWVNDFAVAMTIRKLVEQRDAARSPRGTIP